MENTFRFLKLQNLFFSELNILWLLGISVGVLRCYWRRHDHAQINWEGPLLLTRLRMAGYTDGWRVLACLSDRQEGVKGVGWGCLVVLAGNGPQVGSTW